MDDLRHPAHDNMQGISFVVVCYTPYSECKHDTKTS